MGWAARSPRAAALFGATVVYGNAGDKGTDSKACSASAVGRPQTALRFVASEVPLVALDHKSLSFVDLFELVEFPDRLAAAKTYIADARTRGVLGIGIDRVLAFDDVQEAHRILETGRLAGKLVLRVD